MKVPHPRSLRGQMALLLGGSSTAMLGVALAALLTLRAEEPAPPPGAWPDAIGVANALRAIKATREADRPAMASALSTPDLPIVLDTDAPCRPQAEHLATRSLRRALYALEIPDTWAPLVMNCVADGWPPGFTHVSFESLRATFLVRNYARVHGSGMLLATLPIMLWIGTIAAGAAVLLLWLAWYVRRPLGLLADAVAQYEALGRSAPIREAGPSEVRGVIHAFNALQERLARSAEARVCALMGVAHDLRTPVTRLALRVEMGGEYADREGMSRDIDLMKRMLDNAMSLFRGHDETEAWEMVDLAAIAREVSADFAAVGRAVRARPGPPVLLRCQPVAMTRLFGNLLENGRRHASTVSVVVDEEDGEVVIEVSDDGPGMSVRQRRSAFMEMSRKIPEYGDFDGHLGLGLPIVAKIVREHHGRMALLDAKPCGLVVRIVLPCAGSGGAGQPDMSRSGVMSC
ncbi:ATP-binding protein [Acetobacter sacchari]|nr:HAMP domain-containing sensor histidine kinase [Acetobacter sacchari]